MAREPDSDEVVTPTDEVVTFTDDAVETARSLLRDAGYDPRTAGLRLSVERGGCAGLSYRFDLAEAPGGEDLVSESGGFRVFVDRASRPFLEGAEFDVAETVHGTGFRIDNPNGERECGCGLSFR